MTNYQARHLSNYHTAYIGLGSNLGNPVLQLNTAINALEKLAPSKALLCSPFYTSTAIGPGEQPDYINAVVKLKTQLSPLALLHQLQHIEQQQGRQREVRWGARTLDLDLLLYDELTMDSNELQIPHPEMINRNFVLYPLYDVAPELVLSDTQNLAQIIQKTSTSGLRQLEEKDVNIHTNN